MTFARMRFKPGLLTARHHRVGGFGGGERGRVNPDGARLESGFRSQTGRHQRAEKEKMRKLHVEGLQLEKHLPRRRAVVACRRMLENRLDTILAWPSAAAPPFWADSPPTFSAPVVKRSPRPFAVGPRAFRCCQSTDRFADGAFVIGRLDRRDRAVGCLLKRRLRPGKTFFQRPSIHSLVFRASRQYGEDERQSDCQTADHFHFRFATVDYPGQGGNMARNRSIYLRPRSVVCTPKRMQGDAGWPLNAREV